jgi:putative nucleotidyltransferase with HDIG domain
MVMDDYSLDPKKNYTKENLVKVASSQLQVGMYVAELDRPWLETPFLTQGFDIRHRSQVAKIAQYCDHVFVLREGSPRKKKHEQISPIGPKKAKKENTGTLVANLGRSRHKKKPLARSRPAYDNVRSIREEHPVARAAHRKGKSAVKKLLHSAQIGQMLDTAAAEEVVTDCVGSIISNADAMIWMSKIKHEHEYTAEHSLNVCILAIAFGRYLNFEEDELQKLGLCGLLHDVGKMKVPAEILDKPGDLNEEEKRIMESHTVAGHKLLTETAGVPPLAIDVVLNHHERPDGSGYPRGLAEGEISEYAKIISVVDAYDAMTSDRCYSRAKSPVDAQKILYENRSKQFDEECSLAFMQAIGPYPPGTWVELHNGMVGIVLAGRRKFRHLPSVILVLDGDGQRVEQKTVDLHLTDSGKLARTFLIKKTLKDGTHGLRLEDFRLEVEAAS